jgi:calcium channel MID1
VTNLTFCEGITYSVPSNPRLFPNETSLRDVYDNYTIANFKYFENAMMQIPCNTTSSAQYSLATGCDNCTRAYKDWFCAVSLPRCTDFTRQEDYLQVRNVGSPSWNGSLLPTDTPLFKLANSTAAGRSSRNSMIDTTIQPGPYKELLPCDDLCYNVVRNCPAAIGFTCPLPGYIGFNTSYAQRFNMSIDRAADIYPPQCNFPGAIKTSASNRVLPLSLFCVFSTWLLALMFI